MPDMKTALTTALTGTGLKPKTQVERIWNWLKDHPDQTSRRLQTELKIPQSSVSSLLTQMVKRNMLSRKTETDRFGVRLTYRISPSMKEFELLPASKTTQPKKPSSASAELPVQMHCTEEKPIPVQVVEAGRRNCHNHLQNSWTH